MKRAIFALAALLMAASMLWAGYLLRGGESKPLPPPPPVAAHKLAALYATALPDLDGHIQTLGQWRGKVLVVNYWATWCLPCRDEMPMFSALQTRYAAHGVQFVGIADDQVGKVREFVRQTPVAYPLLIGGMDAFGITADFGNAAMGLPFTIILDRDGQLQSSALGRVDEAALTRQLDRLVPLR